jgi:hypothetical protein
MAITITINGELREDQSLGLQDDDFVIDNTLTGLNTTFRTTLNGLAASQLSAAQKQFAADNGAASESNFVTVNAGGETVNDLFFSDPTGALFDGDQVFYNGSALQTVGGANIYFWSLGGNLVIATTSASSATAGEVVAAFYLDEAANHLSAGVQMVTFIPLDHPNTGSNDETVNWSDLLNISAAGSASFDFDNLESGNFLWAAVGSESVGLLVTGQDLNVVDSGGKLGDIVKGGADPSDSVNTSQGGIGATIGINAQHFVGGPKVNGQYTDGPIAVFTLVSGYVPLTGVEQATGINVNQINYDNYINTTSAAIFLSQTTGGTTTKFTISLWEAGGGNSSDHAPGSLLPEEGYSGGAYSYIGDQNTDSNLHDDTSVNVASVTIGADTWLYNEANIATGVAKHGVTVTIVGNDITVIGAKTGDTVTFTALNDPGDPNDGTFNRFTVEGLAGTGAFDIGRIDLTQGVTVSEPIGDTMFVDDDGPSLPPPTQDPLELTTDDTLISDDDTLSTDLIFTAAPVFGTDGPNAIDPITYSLRIAGLDPDPDSGLDDTATGKNILLKVDGDDVVGIVDEDGSGTINGSEALVAVRWSLSGNDPLDKDTETVTFTQYRAVVHDDPTDPDEDGLPGSAPSTVLGGLLFLDQTAVDGDGDVSAVSSFDLGAVTQLWDDGPSIGDSNGEIDDGLVDFAAGDSVTNDLDGVVGKDPNSSPYTITDYTASLTINGVLLHGILSNDDTLVTYWADTGNNGTFGDAGDTAYYTMELGDQGGSGDYTFTVLVNPPPATTEFNFDDLPSGSNLFGIVGDAAAGLIIFGHDIVLKADHTYIANQTQEVKTSQAGLHDTIGIESQMFDPGDAAYFTFVKNPDPNFTGTGLGSTEADDADNILYGSTLEGTSAFIRIAQLQGNTAPKMSIQLFNIDDDNPQGVNMLNARGVNEAGKDPDIIAVRVYAADGTTLLESFSGGVEAGLSNTITIAVNAATGVATVQGFGTNYVIEWDADEDFDQTLITGVAGKFDIGGFGFEQSSATPDQKLDFEATVTDGDGDTDVATWQIGIDGTGSFDDNHVDGVSII